MPALQTQTEPVSFVQCKGLSTLATIVDETATSLQKRRQLSPRLSPFSATIIVAVSGNYNSRRPGTATTV